MVIFNIVSRLSCGGTRVEDSPECIGDLPDALSINEHISEYRGANIPDWLVADGNVVVLNYPI